MQLESRVLNHTRATAGSSAALHNPNADDDVFVGLALSGGGSRSANFAAACMFELQRLGVLRRIDVISSVSGGSLPAAMYCCYTDDEWNPGDVERKLTHSYASDLIGQFVLPWNWFSLWFTDYDRSDILAASFREHLFSRGGRALTFADLRGDRPRLLINCTDLQSAKNFAFTNETFDELNSDLGAFPLSYAVTASAAVPVVLHPVTLRDHAHVVKQYRHLIDGGIVDNLGVTTLAAAYQETIDRAPADGFAAKAAAGIDRTGPFRAYARGAVFIVIDARTEFDADLSGKSDIGTVASVEAGTGLVASSLLNRVSSATLAEMIVKYASAEFSADELRAKMAKLEDKGTVDLKDKTGRPVRIIHLALSRLGSMRELPSQDFASRVNSIATYFNIEPTEAYRLYQAGKILVREAFGAETPGGERLNQWQSPDAQRNGR